MAKQNDRGDKGLKQSKLIEELTQGGAQSPDVRMLIGFLGKSTRDGYWRLYVTPEFDCWIEFAEDDVIRSQAIASGAPSPVLEASAVWLKRDATLQYTQSLTAQRQAEFLQGAITQQYLPQTGAEGLSGAADAELIGTIIRIISRLFCRPPMPPMTTVSVCGQSMCQNCATLFC